MKTLFRTLCIFVMGALLAINAVAIDVTAPMGTELSGGDFREEADDADVLNMTLPSELSLVSEQEREHEENVEPLRTQVFQLNDVQAQDVMGTLAESGFDIKSTQLLSERGSIVMDADTNQLIVTDTPSRLERFASVIVQIDIPVRQVMIEARLVDARDGWGSNLDTRIRARLQHRDNQFIISDTLSQQTNARECDFNMFSLSFSNIEEQGSYFFTFPQSFARYLQLELKALELENYGRNIASPRLMTTDRITARVELGVQIPYLQGSSSGAISVEYKAAVLILEVTPRITPNGGVELNILVIQDAPLETTCARPMINTNRVNTQVVVENGGTVVIGGIHSLYSSLEDKKELILFITPRITHEDEVR